MTAIIYFGEMLVVSILAIVLLAISQLRMSSGAALFAGGVVAAAGIAKGFAGLGSSSGKAPGGQLNGRPDADRIALLILGRVNTSLTMSRQAMCGNAAEPEKCRAGSRKEKSTA
jgi:hypothetical protein